MLKIASSAGLGAALLLASVPVPAADNPGIERLATCQNSWLEWKSANPAQLTSFIQRFQAEYAPNGNTAFFNPKSAQTRPEKDDPAADGRQPEGHDDAVRLLLLLRKVTTPWPDYRNTAARLSRR